MGVFVCVCACVNAGREEKEEEGNGSIGSIQREQRVGPSPGCGRPDTMWIYEAEGEVRKLDWRPKKTLLGGDYSVWGLRIHKYIPELQRMKHGVNLVTHIYCIYII